MCLVIILSLLLNGCHSLIFSKTKPPYEIHDFNNISWNGPSFEVTDRTILLKSKDNSIYSNNGMKMALSNNCTEIPFTTIETEKCMTSLAHCLDEPDKHSIVVCILVCVSAIGLFILRLLSRKYDLPVYASLYRDCFGQHKRRQNDVGFELVTKSQENVRQTNYSDSMVL